LPWIVELSQRWACSTREHDDPATLAINVGSSGGLDCGCDPHDEVGTLGLRNEVQASLGAVVKTLRVDDARGRAPFRIEQILSRPLSCRQRADCTPDFLCQLIEKA